ncbi:MAG TPA: hypothetical protein VFH51_02795, partial [Myxococcota bacterium]|nr:hypothetical protein [Myxococcota bacterium]
MGRHVALAVAVALAGCGVRIESPYQLNDLKVVAVVAEPPAVVAGARSALRAYLAVGSSTPLETLQLAWEYCASHNAFNTDVDCAAPVPLPTAAPMA